MQYTNVISITGAMTPAVPERRNLGLRNAIGQMFGCKHRHLSRPFTRDRQTYLSCLDCGMRREFDLQSWKPRGTFYAEHKLI